MATSSILTNVKIKFIDLRLRFYNYGIYAQLF